MKQKFFTFTTALIIYGLIFGTLMYFTEANKNIGRTLFSGIFFGTFMAIFDTFMLPRINSYFANRKKNK